MVWRCRGRSPDPPHPVPLWDPVLAAEEVRRCAAKGSHAIAFSENPSKLGFPSLYAENISALETKMCSSGIPTWSTWP